jgi:rare lipoprotein A
MTRARFVALLLAGVVIEGCGRKKARIAQLPAPPTPSGPDSPPDSGAAQPPAPDTTAHVRHPRDRRPPALPSDYAPETGVASWYGHPYHGRASASGEIYDMEQMTAAHRTLPFGTRVQVENLDNGMTTEVRINDRGPFVGNRVIDLSHAAAGAIQMIGPGIAHVRLTIVAGPAVPEPALFAIQVAAFANRDNADRMQTRMAGLYGAAELRLRAGTPPVWRVLVGRAPDPEHAETLARQIRAAENVPEAFVVRLDPIAAPFSNTSGT